MKSVMNSTKIRKKLNELKSTFITMKEDEPQKIDIKKKHLKLVRLLVLVAIIVLIVNINVIVQIFS